MQLVHLVHRLTFCYITFVLLSSILGMRSVRRSRLMLRRKGVTREDLKAKICFDYVGCFVDPPPHLSLKRPPEHPSVIKTKFLLYTRDDRKSAEILEYGDEFRSIVNSRFNTSKSLKVVIHGYKGSGNDVGAIQIVQSLLDLEDTNVLILDWTRGAATTYQAAVANTELVGRQLALVLLDMINLGTDPKEVHVVGFSLGAHIAGCASEVLKKRNILLARITGLDPASPFFRHNIFRERSKKLDATDAQLVDVIHTDGSEDFADGFGLLKPIGHVDFFPNGGREQPGCVDVKNSVVVSHLNDEALTREIACSHLRAWRLFISSVNSQKEKCRFKAWPCAQGGNSYIKGLCFPMESTEWSQEMGYGANRGPSGIYYLATLEKEPYCGDPLRASVRTLEGTPKTTGILSLKILHQNASTVFNIKCSLPKRRNEWMMFYNIAAAEFLSLPEHLKSIMALVTYYTVEGEREDNSTKEMDLDTLFLNKIAVEDRKGNSWEYCNRNIAVNFREAKFELQNGRCTTT